VNTTARDIVCGAFGIALAGLYYLGAQALPVSLLSDAVGAAGVPKALAVALVSLSALLIIRAIVLRALTHSDAEKPSARTHLRALGVVALGGVYAAAAPIIGYPVSIALLIGLTALYFGLRPDLRLVLVAALGAAVFWALFVKMLGVSMPAGIWLRLIA
jgi:putative tricarboxylic transport membrane protein